MDLGIAESRNAPPHFQLAPTTTLNHNHINHLLNLKLPRQNLKPVPFVHTPIHSF